MTLQNNAGDNLTLSADGPFSFSTPVLSGSTYEVTVLTQPQTGNCVVSGGTGSVGGAPIESVTVNCAPNTYTVGGTIIGLAGEAVILANNGGDELTVSANGSFAFATPLTTGDAYEVTVAVQPGGQTCAVTSGAGVVASANVSNIAVTCTANKHTVGGTLVGLGGGSSVVLQNNGGDNLTLSADGAFTFPTPATEGSSFNVGVLTQPTGGLCTVSGGTGAVGSADVTSVVVNCAPNSFTIGGTVSGLVGRVLLKNGGETINVAADGSFAFPTPATSGSSLSVTVQQQPKGQTCLVTDGTGTVGSSNVTNVSVTCVSNKYKLGGTLSGVKGTVILVNNGGDQLVLNANGAFSFKKLVAGGAVYHVTVKHQPANQRCTVTNGAGTVGSADITDVAVTCVSVYSIGGNALGITDSPATLQNNGADDLMVSATGEFVFPIRLLPGASYSVTVKEQPTGKTCTVTNGSGIVGSSNVNSVVLTCL